MLTTVNEGNYFHGFPWTFGLRPRVWSHTLPRGDFWEHADLGIQGTSSARVVVKGHNQALYLHAKLLPQRVLGLFHLPNITLRKSWVPILWQKTDQLATKERVRIEVLGLWTVGKLVILLGLLCWNATLDHCNFGWCLNGFSDYANHRLSQALPKNEVWLSSCASSQQVSEICQPCHTPQTCANEGKGVSRDILFIIRKKLTATPHKNLLKALALACECSEEDVV